MSKIIQIVAPYMPQNADLKNWHHRAILKERYEVCVLHASKLMDQGLVVLNLYASRHEMGLRFGPPKSANYWQEVGKMFIRNSAHEVHVLCTPGWQDCEEVQSLLQEASSLNIPVQMIKESELVAVD